MTLCNVSRALVLGLFLTLIMPQGASAEVVFSGETTGKSFSCDADASHPKKVRVFQFVQGDYRDQPFVYMVVEYERYNTWDAGEGPTSGTVKTILHVLRDGKWRKVGRLRATVHNEHEEAWAQTGAGFEVSLEPGDTLRWTFSFKQVPEMLTGDQFYVGGEIFSD